MTLAFAPERIEHWPLARLQPYAKNAKLHGPDQVAKLAASMAEFGWTVPCLVGENGELIAGHGRVLAAEQLGLTEAPVIVLGHLTDAQRRAYRIADNRLAESPWNEGLLSAELQDLLAEDFDLSLVGFSDGELDKLLAFDPDGGGEEEGGAGGTTPPVTIPEPPRNPASRTGDLWILGDHRLLCGDSTCHDDVRRLMNGERAVLFATDPPYLVDYDGSNHPTRNKDWSASYGTTWDDSSQGAELYDGFIAAAVAEAITEDAAWYCWHASRRQAMLEACWEKAGAFVHQQIIWVKDRGVLTRSHYLWKHEPCFMGWRRPNRPPKVAEQTLPSTWEIPSFAKDERPDHPTPKPLDAFGIPMRQHVARGGLCYEPFCGSGSQIMAGEANGRRVFAMEISPAYVDVAVERWQAETGKAAILDGDGRTFVEVKAERLEPAPRTGTIRRAAQQRVATVQAAVAPGWLASERIDALAAVLERADMPASVSWTFRGEAEEQADAQAFLSTAFAAAAALMFIVLVLQFNSFHQALIVMSAILFSTAGVLLGLLVTGRPFGVVMGGVGTIALAGIVVNNNIVLIDTYNALRRAGEPPLEAVLRTGAQRLRPVLLTSVTTGLGLMPMVLGLNVDFLNRITVFGAPSTQWWTELSATVVGGLAVATALTLLVTPTLLLLGERLSARRSRVAAATCG